VSLTCRDLVNLLLDYVGGDLSDEDRRKVERHVCDCPPCGVYLRTYQITIRVGGQLPQRPLRPDFACRLADAVREEARRCGRPPEA
jgi:anti-sigma factor RsiW